MNKKQKISSIFIILSVFLLASNMFFPLNFFVCVAQEEDVVYSILDENNICINSSYDCKEGDMFISEGNVLYKIVGVNEKNLVAYAKQMDEVVMPEVREENKIIPISVHEKKIGMYHTHNDESYVIGDGYDSVYGEGGIMDIGDIFAKELNKHNINVYESNTLHLPHDSKAYVRSKTTAKNLLENNLDAIFDVHRDGVSRKQFLGELNGKEMSKIRIVIGKSNANYTENLEFAKAIKSYADKKYPGLIKDIYMGSGTYNQNLSKTSLLFEMGTYLIEKDYVKTSIPYLADTIDKVMYTTAVEIPKEEQTNGETFGEIILDIETGGENANGDTSSSTGSSESFKPAFIILFVLTVAVGVLYLYLRYTKIIKNRKKKHN